MKIRRIFWHLVLPLSKQISFQSDNSEAFQKPNPKQKLCQDLNSPDAESIIFPLQNDTKNSATFEVGQDSTNKVCVRLFFIRHLPKNYKQLQLKLSIFASAMK